MQIDAQGTTQHPQAAPPTRQGLLFVLSAPSGTGKDSVIHTLKEQGTDIYVVPSITARPPRPGESEGNPYHFVSEETFKQMVAEDKLIEYAQVHGNWYGQPKEPIRTNLQAGRDVLLKIDVQGAATIRQKIPEAIFIFLIPGSFSELKERLINRQTETPEQQKRRLEDARSELAQQSLYDYVIENRQDHLQEAVDQLRAIIEEAHRRSQPQHIEL
mgnify:CR=1 FL=1